MTRATPALSRRAVLAALVLLPLGGRAQAVAPREVAAGLPDARLLGSGELRFFGLPIYDARLWVGPVFDAAAPAAFPLALELDYRRALDGGRIAERSLVEMQRVGGFSAALGGQWLAAMRSLFPDVQRGDRLTGLYRPGQGLAFFFHARPIGELADADFARRFIGIWLAPETSQPRLRRQLLGVAG